MAIGQDTFGISKKDYTEKLTRIINNHRASSKLIAEPREFILRSCRLSPQYEKMANDPEVLVYLRNIETANGRKVKMISLERGATRQPVPKNKLVSFLYPPKKMACTATPEESYYNKVKGSMRNAIHYQLKEYRDSIELPVICSITGKKILRGMRTDVDHVSMTFSELCDKFIEEKGLKYVDVVLKGPPTAKVFVDQELWDAWIEYHSANARYSLTLASANRSKGSDGYSTPKDLLGSFEAPDSSTISLDF